MYIQIFVESCCGRIGDISNISIKREEVMSERQHFPLWGLGPPFPSPVYGGTRLDPSWGTGSASLTSSFLSFF